MEAKMEPQHRGEETRSHILDAAMQCFAEHGYDATGVAEICERAKVTKGAFYYHFPSKQAVFIELLERWLGELDKQLAAAQSGAATVPDGLLRMTDMAQQVFQAAGGQLPMFLEFWNKAVHDQAIWQATIAPYHRYRDFFSNIIRAGIAEGTLRPVDPDTAAQVIVSLAVGLVLQGALDPKGADWGQAARDGIQIFLEGLLRK
jgi:AcrR family transcriptional regulator